MRRYVPAGDDAEESWFPGWQRALREVASVMEAMHKPIAPGKENLHDLYHSGRKAPGLAAGRDAGPRWPAVVPAAKQRVHAAPAARSVRRSVVVLHAVETA